MADIVKRISYAMSLRTPQTEALSYLDAISANCDYKKTAKRKLRQLLRHIVRGSGRSKSQINLTFPLSAIQWLQALGKPA